MASKKPGPARPPPPQLSETGRSIFDNREQLNERGEKLGNLVRLTEPPDPTKFHPEPPDELFSKAESKFSSGRSGMRKFFSSFTDKRPNQNVEEAAELYTAAGKKWKLDGPEKKWSRDYRKAANSLEKAAKCFVETDNPHGQVMNLSEAAQCWRNVPELTEALRVSDQCAELYLDLNKLVRAAKEIQSMADAYRRLFMNSRDTQHSDLAIRLYNRAYEYFQRDGKSRAACSRVNLECATLLVIPQMKIDEAGIIFENEAMNSANEKLLRYGAKYHFFKAGLCKLHDSGSKAHDAFNRYCDEFPAFFETREAVLLAELISAVNANKFGDWTKALERHEQCTKLDPWHKEVVGFIQARHFTQEDELNFDLEEFLDFNKVPGLDDYSTDEASESSSKLKSNHPEPDLT